MSKYIIGITGASGSIYAYRLLDELIRCGHEVHLVITENGKKVSEYETGISVAEKVSQLLQEDGRLYIHGIDDLFAPIASGSFRTDGMVILPCSMATLGELASGSAKSLLGRAADVCLKEKSRLVVVPRETPLNVIQLRNMLTLAEAGAHIVPAMPGFYHKPEALDDLIDFVVGKVLDSLGIQNHLFQRWGEV